MIESIRQIGKWQIEKTGKNDLEVLIKEPGFKEGGKIVAVKVNLDKKEFQCIELEDYDPSRAAMYLFRGGVSQGPNATPIAVIPYTRKGKSEAETKGNLIERAGKTFDGKIKKWFEKYAQHSSLSKDETEFLGSIKDILEKNRHEIVEAITTLVADIPKKQGRLLTVKIYHDKKWRYIGEYDVFRKLLETAESARITAISQKDQNCSVCGKRRDLVSGDVSVFKFYTIDKPGFITGGFKEHNAWRNYPVCPTCKLELEEGRKFIESNLTYKFYGHQYFLIPKPISTSFGSKNEIINILMDSNKNISLKERVKKKITNDDSEILEVLSREHDFMTLDFLFLRREQSAERIELLIEDVFPSRIKRLFEAKDAVDTTTGGSFTFGNLRDFFLKSDEMKRNYDLDKYFMDITDKIFRGVIVDFSFLLRFFMTRIRKEFVTEGYFLPIVKSAIMSMVFLENLCVVTFKEVDDMEKSIFDDMINRYGKSLNGPVKQGLVFLGALTQLLLNKQWRDRNAKPFMKQLKGLKMDQRDIMSLLPKVQNKLEEYDSFDKGKRIIATEASTRLLEASSNWNLSVDEINFYFACGMNLADEIAAIVYSKKEE